MVLVGINTTTRDGCIHDISIHNLLLTIVMVPLLRRDKGVPFHFSVAYSLIDPCLEQDNLPLSLSLTRNRIPLLILLTMMIIIVMELV